MGILTLLVVVGIAAALARIARLSPAAALVQATATIIIALYVGGLAGVLWWTALAIHLAGAVTLGLEALRIARTGRTVSVPVPVGVLVLLAGLFWLLHSEREYYMYDEYSHWGIFLKEMLALDTFWLADTNSMHPRYPPGATLWQYLFSALGIPTEGKAYLAQFVLLITPLLVLWNGLSWRQVGWVTGIAALCLVVLANYGLGVLSLYIDPVLSTWFAGVILLFMLDSEHSWLRRALLSVAPVIVIALFKDGALGFSFAASGIIAALVFVGSWQESPRLGNALRRASFALVFMCGAAALSVQVWTWNRDAEGSPEEVVSLDGIVQGIGAGSADEARKAEVARRFFEVARTQQLSNDAVTWQFNEFTYGIRSLFAEPYRLTTLAAFVLFAVWSAVLVACVRQGVDRLRWSIAAAGTLVTAVGYLAVLLLSYPFVFGDYGMELPSYVRYANTVVVPMILFAFAPLVPAFNHRSPESRALSLPRARAGLFAAALLVLWGFEFPYLQPLVAGHPKSELRKELEPITTALNSAVGRDPLWIYLPQDSPNGFVGRMMQYLLSPTPVTVERSPSHFERDPEALAARFREFSYAWIPAAPPPEVAGRISPMSRGVTQGLFIVTDDGRELAPVTAGSDEPAAVSRSSERRDY